jgi:hypothetical protein
MARGAEVDYGSLQKEIENQLRIAKLQARCPGCPGCPRVSQGSGEGVAGRGLRWDGYRSSYMILDVHVSS